MASGDDLFGAGAKLGGDLGDFVAKAKLRVPRREHPLLPARDIVARLEHAYDEHLDEVLREVEQILGTTDSRKSVRLRLVEPEGGDDLFKAALDVAKLRRQGNDPTDKGSPITHTGKTKQPVRNLSGQQRARRGTANLRDYQRPHGGVAQAGVRGGKWYRDKKGNIRYGEPPKGSKVRTAGHEEVQEHLKAYRPAPEGRGMPDVEVVAHVRRRGGEHGFTAEEAKFLEAWYGAERKSGDWDGGDLREAFEREQGGEGQPVESREESMIHWLASQDWGAGGAPTAEDQQGFFHADVKPILDDLFSRYAELRESPDLERRANSAIKGNPRRRLAAALAKHSDFVTRVARSITGGADRAEVGIELAAALAALGLLEVSGGAPSCGGYHEGARAGAAEPDGELLGEGDESMAAEAEGIADLPASAVAVLAAAARLGAAWDSASATYQFDGVEDSGLLRATQISLTNRLGEIPAELVHDQVEDAAHRLGDQLTLANHGADPRLLDLIRAAASDPAAAVAEHAKKIRAWRESHSEKVDLPHDWLDLASRGFEQRVETMVGRPLELFEALDAAAPGQVGTRAEWQARFQRRQIDPETGECVDTNPEDLRGMRERVKVAMMHAEDGES